MGTKHTLAPWELRHGYYIFACGREIATVWKGGSVTDETQDMANARLIAAAPDLLEALKALVADLKPYMGQGRMDDKIRNAIAAIAKARGE